MLKKIRWGERMQLPKFEVGKITIGDLVDLVAEQMPDQMAVEYLEPRISHLQRV